jgi:hypothetical protein
MFNEIYYCRTKTAPRLTLSAVADRFRAAGLQCSVEPEAEKMFWLDLSPLESNLLASVEDDGSLVFATFNFVSKDPASVAEAVEQVMQSIGFSADEEADI